MKTRLALALIILVCAAAFAPSTMLQNSLLYFPQPAPLAELAGSGLAPWPSPESFRGLLAEPAGPARATVVVFHGNAGHAGHRAYYAQALAPLGLRVILAEYPGYGPRGGELGEAALVADAVRTLELAHAQHGAPLLVLGESLGAGVAAAAAARIGDKLHGLLLVTPWDRLENVARHHYGWLPVGWLLRDKYDSVGNLAGFTRPVVVALAEHDEIIPPRMAVALHESLRAPKRLKTLRGAGHNDWVERVDAAWWREVADFLLATPARTD